MDQSSLKEQLEDLSELRFLSPEQMERLFGILESTKKGEILYPTILKKEIRLSYTDTADLLNILRDRKIVEAKRVILCPRCHKTSTVYSMPLSGFVQLQSCLYCGSPVALPENAFILYRRHA